MFTGCNENRVDDLRLLAGCRLGQGSVAFRNIIFRRRRLFLLPLPGPFALHGRRAVLEDALVGFLVVIVVIVFVIVVLDCVVQGCPVEAATKGRF